MPLYCASQNALTTIASSRGKQASQQKSVECSFQLHVVYKRDAFRCFSFLLWLVGVCCAYLNNNIFGKVERTDGEVAEAKRSKEINNKYLGQTLKYANIEYTHAWMYFYFIQFVVVAFFFCLLQFSISHLRIHFHNLFIFFLHSRLTESSAS